MTKKTLYLACWMLCILAISSCANKQAGNEKEANPTTKPPMDTPKTPDPQNTSATFKDFLVKFTPATSMEEWPENGLEPLVLNGDIFAEKPIDPIIKVTYSTIGPEFNPFIPLNKIKKLHPDEKETEAPLKSFKFYGFEKIKKDKYWLVSIFAMKQDRNYKNEYFAHPFLLATFTPEGKLIDDHVWWLIDHDMLEVWTEVDVRDDTLLTGRKEDMNDEELSVIWTKTVITEEGKFKILYTLPERER